MQESATKCSFSGSAELKRDFIVILQLLLELHGIVNRACSVSPCFLATICVLNRKLNKISFISNTYVFFLIWYLDVFAVDA